MRKIKFTDKVNRLNQFSLQEKLDKELFCFSTYKLHSIYVLKDGKAFQLGSTDPKICFDISNFKGEDIKKVGDNVGKEINIVDDKNHQYPILSAVCGYCYSLFLVKGEPLEDSEKEADNLLAYYYKTQDYHFDKSKIKTKDYTIFNETEIVVNPKLFKLDDCNPIAIYGGWKISAAIDYKSDNIIVFQPCPSPLSIISFPPNCLTETEYTDSIACLENSLLIHTTKKRVFEYKLNQSEDDEGFTLINIKDVVQISGTYKHCFLVTEDYKVYGRGLNDCGQLGLGEITNENKKVETFTLINTFEDDYKEIVAAYAGFNHSIFKTKDKSFLACGSNSHGQLGLDTSEYKECYTPTKIPNVRANVAIAGDCCSVFYDDNYSNWPNRIYNYSNSKQLRQPNSDGWVFKEVMIEREESEDKSKTDNHDDDELPQPKKQKKSLSSKGQVDKKKPLKKTKSAK